MSIELVVFDLAGTTVKDNQDVHRMLRQALARHGINISNEDANAVLGFPKPVAIRRLLERRYVGPRPITQDWITAIHEVFVKVMIDFYRTDPSVGEKAGVYNTFKKLKQHQIKIAVDTEFDRKITDALLQRLGWANENLIDATVSSDEVERGRPYPDLIFRAMELTNTRHAKNVAKVGDTASDMQQGNSAGCGLVIGVTTGAFSRQALSQEKHSHLIEQISEILEILDISH